MPEKHLLDQQLEASLHGDFELGWKLSQELERLSPYCHRSAFNRAFYEMRRGDLLKGLENLDRGRWEGVFGGPPLPTKKSIYRNEDLRDRHLLICSEGGLGDEIINLRFARDFHERGAKVTITCDPSLASVFARAPGVSAVVGHAAAPHVYHDFWVPGMSAPRVLEYSYEKLHGEPYLTVDPLSRQKWRRVFESRFSKNQRPRIGLRFHGNPRYEHELLRRFNPADLIRAVGPLPWINLQKEESTLGLNTWEDTLAVLEQLDLVVTSCTSIAHASAALGKETWVLTPIMPYYIWALPGERTPWYKSVRLFRQHRFADWSGVFADLTRALEERYS